MSRPSTYSEKIADQICDLLSEGSSLVEICRGGGMPDRSTVMRWMSAKSDFAAKIARARECGQADYLFDRMAQTEADVLAGAIPSDTARTVIASMHWRASKLSPKRYGQTSTVETNATVTVRSTSTLDISELTDEQLDSFEIALRSTVAQLSGPDKSEK